jgi:hypothetical protein
MAARSSSIIQGALAGQQQRQFQGIDGGASMDVCEGAAVVEGPNPLPPPPLLSLHCLAQLASLGLRQGQSTNALACAA